MFPQRLPVRLSLTHTQLGDPVMDLHGGMPEDAALLVAPLAEPPDDARIVRRLDVLIDEVVGLREDLASRTLAARAKRFWAWLRQLW